MPAITAIFLLVTIVPMLVAAKNLVASRRGRDIGTNIYYRGDYARTIAIYLVYYTNWILCLWYVHGPVPIILKIFGFVLLLAGTGTRLAAFATLKEQYTGLITARKDTYIVESGIYAIVRHPLHLGLVLHGMGMVLLNWRPIQALPAMLLVTVLLTRNFHEDKFLYARYGPAARDYQRRVPALNFFLGLTRLYQAKQRLLAVEQ